MPTSARSSARTSPWVFRAQLALLGTFCVFAGSVVLWISRLIYVSWQLEDVFSASIGIALVAIPIFLFLSVMVNYVFWGLHGGRS
jgi:uncharacterized membrane protein YcjF (UPF0283 family)